jgi:hypothetical protein
MKSVALPALLRLLVVQAPGSQDLAGTEELGDLRTLELSVAMATPLDRPLGEDEISEPVREESP